MATTVSPFLIAALLNSDYFSQQLSRKQSGEFLTTAIYLPINSHLDSQLDPEKWHLVTSINHDNHNEIITKLKKIKTALGKRSDRIDILTTKIEYPQNKSVYIATPKGQLLLGYQDKDIGKPLYQDLTHLIRSNSK
jgi:hypothetical protein